MADVSNDTQKTLVLTGASRGIGHATVKTFSAAGWRVITCSRHDFPEECPWASGPENHIKLDLTSEQGVEEGLAKMKQLLGNSPLSALVNNAAISPKSAKGKRLGFVETDISLWHQVFQVNFFAPLLFAKGLLNNLAKAQGSIINVTSIAGTRVHEFAGPAYATSKAALAALTREMAAELGPIGVRVNAIAPGEIDTAILSPGTEKLVEKIPLQRLGTPEEVAALIYFLCSSKAAYMTGAEVHINGGEHV